MKLENKIALVTGARRGIGEGIAKKLAEEGAKVVVTDINEDDCKKVAEEIEKDGGEAMALKLDVTDKENIQKVINKVKDEFGVIDILVNNAGIALMEEPEKYDIETVEKVLDVNLKGSLAMAYAVLPDMVEQNYGKIVNIASIAAFVAWQKIYTYSATKGGIVSLTKGLAGDYSPKGINVNAIAPGAIKTKMLDDVSEELGISNEQLIQMTPKRRVGKPEDIANAVAFLASDDADFITGQTIKVDGGYTIL